VELPASSVQPLGHRRLKWRGRKTAASTSRRRVNVACMWCQMMTCSLLWTSKWMMPGCTAVLPVMTQELYVPMPHSLLSVCTVHPLLVIVLVTVIIFFYFSLFSGAFTIFSLSIPFLSTRIVPLHFQAGGRRKRPNLGLVCCVYFVLSVFLS